MVLVSRYFTCVSLNIILEGVRLVHANRRNCTIGGLVCATALKQSSRSEARYTNDGRPVCRLTEKNGQEKLFAHNTQEEFALKFDKQRQFLNKGYIFRQIRDIIANSCFTLVVKEAHGDKGIKGYRWLGSGNGKIYIKRYDIKRTWDEALTVCQSDQGTLIMINSKHKMLLVKSIIKPVDVLKMNYMWIGLRDFKGNNEFRWVNRRMLVYTNWYPHQPSNISKLRNGTTVEENCGILIPHAIYGIHWHDANCGLKHHFICEIAI